MHWLRPFLLLIVTIVLCGCMSWQRISVDEIPTTIQAKDTVRLQTMDGHNLTFVVMSVDSATLVGKELRVLIADIDWLEMEKDETLQRVGHVAVGLLAVTLLVVIASRFDVKLEDVFLGQLNWTVPSSILRHHAARANAGHLSWSICSKRNNARMLLSGASTRKSGRVFRRA